MYPPPEELVETPEAPPSIMGRIGQQAANVVPNILNDMMSLAYNVGVRGGDQPKPGEVPTPYNIPEPTTAGEMAVDVGTELVQSLPLFLSGEGAGLGAAKVIKAAPMVTRMLRLGGAFGTAEMAHSPDRAVVGAGLGAGMGAVEAMLPKPAKYAAAAGLGLATAALAKHEGASDTSATVQGLANTILPLLFGPRAAKTTAKSSITDIKIDAAEAATPGYRQGIGLTERYDLKLEGQRPRVEPPEGALIREPIYSEGEAMKIANAREVPPSPMLRLTDDVQGELPFRSRNGSVEILPPIGGRRGQMEFRETHPVGHNENIGLTEPFLTPAEARRRAGVTPPEGSLIREARFTEGEALKYAEGKTPVATLQPAPAVPKNRVLLSTVLQSENEAVAKTAAEKLGLQYDGVMGADTATPLLQFTPKGGGSSITVPVGATYRELKNAQAAMKVRMAEPRMTPEQARVALANLRESQRAKVDVVVEPKAENIQDVKAELEVSTRYVPAVKSISGKVFKDADHEGAIVQMQQMSGIADSTLTKNGRGYVDKETGEFVTLMDVARQRMQAKPEVATLQSQKATSSPFSLETAPEGVTFGDKVTFKFGDETLSGQIRPGVEPNTFRVVAKDGTPYDIPLRDIVTTPKPKFEARREGDVEQVGGMSGVEAAQSATEPGVMKLGSGKMRLSNFGEQGSVATEAVETLTKYVAAPTIGAAFGYAMPQDEDQRLGSAIMGAAIAGLLAVGGFRVARRLAEAHPDIKKAGTMAEKISKVQIAAKEDSVALVKAITGNEQMAAKAASRWGLSNDYDKLARGIERFVGVHPAATRMLGKARGLVNEYANIMHTAINGLSHIDDIGRYSPQLTKYFEGKVLGRDLKDVPKEIMALAQTAREAREALQRIAIKGLGGGKLATTIEKSIGQYMTTAYKIFHDPKYKPTEKQIEAAAASLGSEWGGLEIRIRDVNNYLQELKTGKALWGGGSSGKSIGSLLTRTNKELTPEFKAMLGEYKDPLERMSFTAVKLINGARSAEFFNEVAKGAKPSGLKYAYDRTQMEVEIATLQQKARLAHSPVERDAAAAKLADLESYVLNTDGASTGRLSNMYLDRRMRDQLANYTFDSQAHLGPMVNGLIGATNFIKYNQVILSPLQLVRQIYQLPVLGLMSKTNPADWIKAGKTILFDKSPAGRAEQARLKRLGVYEGVSQTAELREDIKSMMDGTLDRIIGDRLSRGLRKWEEAWRTPDLIIRVAAFQKKEAQLLEKYGVKQADRATSEAIDHMNRYTMNYSAVPPAVKIGRQLPFINQYLSFAYESARITKNLGQDALKGDPYAIGVLATMATAPFLIQQMSESTLSPEDRKEWDKIKSLGRDYERHNFKFVKGRKSNGDFEYVSFSPLVLHDPYLQSIRAVMAGETNPFTGALGAVNPIAGWDNTPLLNIATTFITGRNRFSGQKLEGAADYAQDVRRSVAPLLLGNDLDRIQRALTRNAEGTLGIIDERTGKASTFSDILQTYATSMRPYTVRPEFVLRQAQAEANDRIRSQQLTYRRVLATNASDEQKERARQNFEAATNQILLSFRDKYGIDISGEE